MNKKDVVILIAAIIAMVKELIKKLRSILVLVIIDKVIIIV